MGPAAVPDAVGTRRTRPWGRLALLAFGPVALVTGLLGGLWRLGWEVPGGELAEFHGPLMISGLFGTVIGLERAVALGGPAYAAPVAAALGTLALLAGTPDIGAALYVAAASVLALASADILRRQPAVFTATLLLGAAAWLVGNILWLAGRPVADLAGWWLAFLVLTIAGERLELSRLLVPKRGSLPLFLLGLALVLGGASLGLAEASGAALFGTGLIVATLWLLRHDVARRSIRGRGAPRFFAACMLAGYAWLAVAGALMILAPPARAAFGYDLALHVVLIGFVLSMVFGHALIILPAVARLRLGYTPLLYGPLVLLHASVALRVAGGLGEWSAVRQASGALTVLALLVFAAAILHGARRRR